MAPNEKSLNYLLSLAKTNRKCLLSLLEDFGLAAEKLDLNKSYMEIPLSSNLSYLQKKAAFEGNGNVAIHRINDLSPASEFIFSQRFDFETVFERE